MEAYQLSACGGQFLLTRIHFQFWNFLSYLKTYHIHLVCLQFELHCFSQQFWQFCIWTKFLQMIYYFAVTTVSWPPIYFHLIHLHQHHLGNRNNNFDGRINSIPIAILLSSMFCPCNSPAGISIVTQQHEAVGRLISYQLSKSLSLFSTLTRFLRIYLWRLPVCDMLCCDPIPEI